MALVWLVKCMMAAGNSQIPGCLLILAPLAGNMGMVRRSGKHINGELYKVSVRYGIKDCAYVRTWEDAHIT